MNRGSVLARESAGLFKVDSLLLHPDDAAVEVTAAAAAAMLPR